MIYEPFLAKDTAESNNIRQKRRRRNKKLALDSVSKVGIPSRIGNQRHTGLWWVLPIREV